MRFFLVLAGVTISYVQLLRVPTALLCMRVFLDIRLRGLKKMFSLFFFYGNLFPHPIPVDIKLFRIMGCITLVFHGLYQKIQDDGLYQETQNHISYFLTLADLNLAGNPPTAINRDNTKDMIYLGEKNT